MVNDSEPSKIKRPAIWVCSAFMIGIVCGVYAAKHGMFTWMLLCLLCLYFAVVVMLLFKRVSFAAVICVLCATVAVVYSFFVYTERLKQPDFDKSSYIITATVLDYDKLGDDYVRYEVDSVEIDSDALDTHMLITVKGEHDIIEIGSRITLSAGVSKPQEARNSDVFDYREYLANKRIYYVAYTSYANMSVIPYENTDSHAFRYELNRFKHNSAEKYREYLTDDASGIVYAITAGDSVYIDEAFYGKYRMTGTAHVLAISGLHVGFIVLFASIITGRLRKYSFWYTAVNLIIVWCYIVFSGMNVSAVRAGIFFTMLCVGKMLKQRCDITNTAFITALLMLIADPMLLFSVSFQLSFAAVLAIGILSPNMSRAITKRMSFVPTEAASGFSVVLCASVGVLLPIAYHYNTVSLVSVAVNFVIVPLFSYIVLFGFLMMLSVTLNIPFLINAVTVIVNGLVRIVDVILDFAAKWEYSNITVASPNMIVIIACVIIMIILSVEKPKWIKNKLIPVCSCMLVIAASIIIPYIGVGNTYTVSFIDVGQAECSLIVTPKNKTIMIDAGEEYGYGSNAEYTIVPYLVKHGNTSIDYLVLSHAHSDHIGAADEVLQSVNVKNLIYCAPDDNDSFSDIISIAQEQGTNIINMYYTTSVKVDDTTFLNRICNFYSADDVNAESLVLEVECANNNLIFAGDMTAEGLDTMDYCDNVLIYKVAHHGSETTLSDKIDEIKPLYSVIFTKEGNTYGLPDDEALEWYQKYSDVILTQEHGEITFTFNDEYVKVFKYIT